ncbi:hypothetical protein F9278_15680 [Streptomyces phaeolivaceus]|uniref:Uncharacterized protein n=1 Tax=Streptomyces phaeolivaceus TaxID=2653200 RepID=A0A5P8K3Q3_9ACTN|nr:hypothetical protein F9278_15680 [Streptomyces phaeolivaceus]
MAGSVRVHAPGGGPGPAAPDPAGGDGPACQDRDHAGEARSVREAAGTGAGLRTLRHAWPQAGVVDRVHPAVHPVRRGPS